MARPARKETPSPKIKEKKKLRRRRKRKHQPDEDDVRAANLVSHLHKRFGTRTARQFEDHSPCLRKNDRGEFEVCNSERYVAMINRANDCASKRLDQGLCQGEYVNTKWRCAFCQQRSLRSILGDLFGPYYVKISDEQWPSFLAKKPPRLVKQTEHWFDLWMHGDCVLSAPGIQLCGGTLPELQSKIVSFWKQHCSVCTKEGATLEFGGKLFHYPCAYLKGKLGPKRPDAE